MDNENKSPNEVNEDVEKVKELANKVLDQIKKQDEFITKIFNDPRIPQSVRDDLAVKYNKFMGKDKKKDK